MLKTAQNIFSDALKDPHSSSEVNTLFSNYSNEEAQARFAIYQNNFFRSLIDILLDVYPSILNLIGKEAFEIIAKAFISQHPPREANVSLYGSDLPRFLSQHPIAKQLPYISDSAHLDWALHAAYYAKEETPLELTAFAELTPDQLMASCITFHPATNLLISEYSIYSIYELANAVDKNNKISYSTPESVLICRCDYSIEHYLLEKGTQDFFAHLMQGAPLGSALEQTADTHSEFDPSSAVSFLIQTQATISIQEAR